MRNRILFVFLFVFVLAAQAAPIRILGIGNSFTMDAMGRELQPVFTSEAQEVILGYPFRGGTWLSQHDAWSNRTDTMPYNYYEYRNGVQTTTGTSSYNLTMAVELEPWDYVIIQSDHDSAGIYKSYEPYLTHLVDFVRAHCSNKNVKIGFYMTWAYDSISTYSAFKYYKYSNQLMYDSIIACAKRVMASHPEFFLIPAGTAIQNARTSYMGHKMNRDGYHLNYTYGNYTAALCWYRAIMGKDPKEITYYPGSVSEYCARMCQAAVHEAFEKPYEVTSLKEEFGRSEGDVQAADESRLRRVTFNGMNVPIVEGQYTYVVPVDTGIQPVSMYSYPHSTKAEQNITDKAGSDVPFDPERYGYFPLVTPALGDTVVYTNKVFAEDKVHITTYTFCLVGTTADKIVYPIASKEDLEDFAAIVNGGRYSINGRLTSDINMNHTRQNAWETPVGTVEHPYTGTFDGQGYTISGFEIYAAMNIKLAALQGVGLFGAIKDATIRGVHIVGGDESFFNKTTDTSIIPEVKTKGAGILCGYMSHSLIEDCSVTMDLYTDMANLSIGLICGRDAADKQLNRINRCWAAGTWRIRANGVYAGILGYSNYAKITNCYNLSKLDLQRNYGARIGGLVGYGNTSAPQSVTIENSYNYGQILDSRGSQTATVYMGAIGGYMNGNHIQTNCYYLEGKWQANGTGNPTTPQSVSATAMTDGTVTQKLGIEFVQGTEYPVLRDTKGEYTCTKSHSDLAQEYGWKTGDTCTAFRLGPVTFSTVNSKAEYKNGFYRNGKEWILYYQHGDGPLHVQADEGYWIKELKFTYGEQMYGILSDKKGAGQTIVPYRSNSTIEVNDTAIQFYVGNTPDEGGNLKTTGFLTFTAFSVLYYKLPEKAILPDQLLTVGNTFQLRPTVTPADAYATCVWSVDKEDIVSVDAQGIVTAKAPGTAHITTTLVNGVADTCQVVVLSNTNAVVTETFSNCQVEQNQSGTTSVMGDKGLYTWRLTNYQRQARDTVGSDQGIRVRYSGDIESDGVQQGGIKSLAFDWRVSGKNNPVNFRVKVGNQVQTYATDPIGSDAIIRHYAYDFRQTSNTSMAVSVPEKQAVNQTFIIVGPVTITPYLLYTQYTDTVQLPQTSYDCTSPQLLINNTDGEGEVTYAIQSDSTHQAAIQDGVLDLSQVTTTGDIVVKASWNEGRVYTAFTLHVLAGKPAISPSLSGEGWGEAAKIIRNNQILILRNGQCFDLIGRPENINENVNAN